MIVGDVQLRTAPCGLRYFKAELPIDQGQGLSLTCVRGHNTPHTELTKAIVDYARAKSNDEMVFYDVEGDNYIVYPEGYNVAEILSSDQYHAQGANNG